ncbi:MAG: DUF4394 domain-containing protein [Chthoniobacterales bacterium]
MKRLLLLGACVLVTMSSVCATRGELIYGLTAQGGLISFDSSSPGSVTNVGAVAGASAGQFFLNIDFRPANGLLYGLAVNTITGASNIYTINTSTAAATMVGTTPFTLSVSIGGRVAMDFNPVTDQARVVSRNGSNYQVSPVTGTITASNTTLNYVPGDPGGSGIPDNVALAHSNNVAGTPATTLYGYSFNFDEVLRIGSANGMPISPDTGQTFTIGGAMQFPLTSNIGFDISGSGAAFLTGNIGAQTLFSVNLATGRATTIGAIAGNPQLVSIAVAPVPEPDALRLLVLGAVAIAARKIFVRGRQSSVV